MLMDWKGKSGLKEAVVVVVSREGRACCERSKERERPEEEGETVSLGDEMEDPGQEERLDSNSMLLTSSGARGTAMENWRARELEDERSTDEPAPEVLGRVCRRKREEKMRRGGEGGRSAK